MSRAYHILNGDALKDRFPPKISGELIVARECLVVGDVSGNSPDEIFAARSNFISSAYGGTREPYYHMTVSEFEKIYSIESSAEIYLWFEDDLFCQVNLWFCSFLILNRCSSRNLYIVRPDTNLEKGFGGMSTADLSEAFLSAKPLRLQELKSLAQLWLQFQKGTISKNSRAVITLASNFPKIKEAIQAQLDYSPGPDGMNRPERCIVEIVEDLGTTSFPRVFREFCKRESIYGFGDLQVQSIFDGLISRGDLAM